MKEAIELIMETGRNKLENGLLWDKFTTFTMFLNYKTFAFSPFFIPLFGKIKMKIIIFLYHLYNTVYNRASQLGVLGIDRGHLIDYSQVKIT